MMLQETFSECKVPVREVIIGIAIFIGVVAAALYLEFKLGYLVKKKRKKKNEVDYDYWNDPENFRPH